ncbi:MAG: hypothetical protein IKA17_04510 [Clostridia bacterium]|nr:hypothetical protein [Clostridia bacterium]
MKKKEQKHAIPEQSAQQREGIDAEKTAETGKLHTGEEKEGFDAESEKEKNAEFEKLISGKFKNQFAQRVQKIIDRRFKEVKKLKETLDKNEHIINLLMKKYNIDDNNAQKLEKEITGEMENTKNNNENKYEDIIRRLIAENAYLKKMRENSERDEKSKARAEKLRAEVEETKKEYSDFDFKEQLKNPEFVRLIRVGVSVKHAYEVTNMDTLLEKNAKNAEKKIVDSIRSKGVRPIENGSRSTSGMIFENNISRLSKKDRKEIAKRAARGEKISF